MRPLIIKKNTINSRLLSIYLGLVALFSLTIPLSVFPQSAAEIRDKKTVSDTDPVSSSVQNHLTGIRITPSALSQSLGGRRENLSLEELIEVAFHFSGTPETDIPRYQQKFNTLIGQLTQKLTTTEKTAADGNQQPDTAIASEAEKAEAVLLFMHKQILKRYSEQQSKLDVELDTGLYNCVSSAVLYLILARAEGLRIGGVKTSDHAFCIVYTEQGNFDVETTNVYGFDPGTKKEFKNEFGKVTGFSYVPPHYYSSRSFIDANALVSLILQNRISMLTEKHQFTEAVGLAVDAYTFLSNTDTFEKMILTFTNVGSWANINHDFTGGLDFINKVTGIYGPHEKLIKTKKDLVHNWIVELLSTQDFEAAGKVIDERYIMGDLPRAEYEEFQVYIHQVKAQELEKSKGPLAAYHYTEQALHMLAGNGTLMNMKNIYLHNYEVQVHNNMAAAFNSGYYEQAKTIIEEALALVPDSLKLKQDLDVVNKALANN